MRSRRIREDWSTLLGSCMPPFLSSEYREKSIMVKSKAKQEKRVETVEEFVERINKSAVRTNGLKKNLKGARR